MEITDAISLLIDSGFKVVPHNVEGWWKDTGKPEDISRELRRKPLRRHKQSQLC